MSTKVHFTPYQGLMSIAERITRAAEKKLGVDLWDGEDGLGAVAGQFLSEELKLPKGPIMIATSGRPEVSPRTIAEQAGIIKKRKRVARPRPRVVKAS